MNRIISALFAMQSDSNNDSRKITPLIMTSANISGEAIIINDDEIKKFGIDILSHDREILTPIDDSVVQINSGKVQLIRRARGYVPLAIKLASRRKKHSLSRRRFEKQFCDLPRRLCNSVAIFRRFGGLRLL